MDILAFGLGYPQVCKTGRGCPMLLRFCVRGGLKPASRNKTKMEGKAVVLLVDLKIKKEFPNGKLFQHYLNYPPTAKQPRPRARFGETF